MLKLYLYRILYKNVDTSLIKDYSRLIQKDLLKSLKIFDRSGVAYKKPKLNCGNSKEEAFKLDRTITVYNEKMRCKYVAFASQIMFVVLNCVL